MKNCMGSLRGLLFLLSAGMVIGQAQSQQPPPPKPTQEQQPATPTTVKPQVGQAGSQAELEEFNKLRVEADTATKQRLIDEFLKKYPESGLVALVHREGVTLGQQTNNFQLMAEHGEKTLVMMPEDFAVMTVLANAYAERNMVDKAEEKAERAIELVTSAQKPGEMSEEQWAQGKKMLLATNFSALGYVHLRRAQTIQTPAERKTETERAIAPFKKAIEYHQTDDVSYWRLGLTYAFLNDYPNAESNLAKAVAVNGIAASYARSSLEDIYKGQHKGSLEGLDQVIAKAKSELALP